VRAPRLVPLAISLLTTLCFASRSNAQLANGGGPGTYGPGIGGDALANTTVGGSVGGLRHFIRFRAEQSSPLVAVRFPFLSADLPGYGGGTGGRWKLELFADDGTADNFPSGPALASQPVEESIVSSNGRLVSFTTPYTTTRGALYHLVFDNIDLDPTNNFFSLNHWTRLSFDEDGPLNERFAESDWKNGYFQFGAWHAVESMCPIADIEYQNGAHQGMSYGEASYLCPEAEQDCTNEQLVGEINGSTKMARERFTVSCVDRVVLGVGVRLLRVEGTSSPLVVSLRNGADEEIDSVTIPAWKITVGPAPSFEQPITSDDFGHGARWVSARFDEPHTLLEGGTYSLRLSSTGGTYWAWVMRSLQWYGYTPQTAFEDGWSEYTVDGSTWLSLGRVEFENDLQFYFITPCAADLNGDQVVDGSDLASILGAWGAVCECLCPADVDRDGFINGSDLAEMLGAWGTCP